MCDVSLTVVCVEPCLSPQILQKSEIICVKKHFQIAGYAKSKDQKPLDDTATFLQDLIRALKLERPVIVSPSMSGAYSLPYLLQSQPQQWGNRARGYVSVAPAFTDKFEEAIYKQCEVRIIRGTHAGVYILERFQSPHPPSLSLNTSLFPINALSDSDSVSAREQRRTDGHHSHTTPERSSEQLPARHGGSWTSLLSG